MSHNVLAIKGNLTADPELRHAQNETAFCNFSIAVNEYSGGKEHTSFFRCTAFGKTAEFVHNYFKKGAPVLIAGRIQQDRWQDKDGNKRETVKILADRVDFAAPRSQGGGDEQRSHFSPTRPGGPNNRRDDYSDNDIPY